MSEGIQQLESFIEDWTETREQNKKAFFLPPPTAQLIQPVYVLRFSWEFSLAMSRTNYYYAHIRATVNNPKPDQ